MRSLTESLLEQQIIPETLLRRIIRTRLNTMLSELKGQFGDTETACNSTRDFIQGLKQMPIAIDTELANEQHYEIPAGFYRLVLGKWLKYSCAYWDKAQNLDQAEEAMLELVAQRAGLQDGQNILDLGCGWGSMSLYAAQRFPNAQILAISNAPQQKQFIDGQAEKLGLKNLEVLTANVVDLQLDKRFDRIISVEMFEHMKNYQLLLEKISQWMYRDSRLFVHIFCHRYLLYHFQVKEDDWIARYFFTGGTMPSAHMLYYFNEHLRVNDHWILGGKHYQKTADAWLQNMDSNKIEIQDLFKEIYGNKYRLWYSYWRIFFLTCSEAWAYNKGNDWLVGHYLLSKEN